MVKLSKALTPPVLKGVKIYPDNPFRLDFILNNGDGHPEHSERSLQQESIELVKYFLTSVTVPEKDLWVNLSPYEKNRIVPHAFGTTQMGRDLLAQDYLLKQITASIIYPEEKIGKEFWAKVHEESYKRFGVTNLPIDTFNKVWVVPEKAVVYENNEVAYIVETHLKVMLEEDYQALDSQRAVEVDDEAVSTAKAIQNNVGPNPTRPDGLGIPSDISSSVIREVILPILEKEVNEGKNFAQLRQIYHSLILAIWFKDKIRQSIFGQAYIDHNKISGVDIADKAAKEKIWAQYVESFKKGTYNYIKEEVDPVTQEALPRKYFSGGAGFHDIRKQIQKVTALPNISFNDAASSTILTVELHNSSISANSDDFESVPPEIKANYEIIRWLDGGGSSAGVLLVRNQEKQMVVLKFANWAGIGSNGTFWLKAQAARLKKLRSILPTDKKARIPQVYDYFEEIDPASQNGLVYYTMEYLQQGTPLSLFYWDHPENAANPFLADLNEIVTFLSDDLYANGTLPVPEGYVKRVHQDRLRYRLDLLKKRSGPVYERLIKNNKLHIGKNEYPDIAALFVKIWESDTIVINGKEYPNGPAILKGLARNPDLYKPTSLPQYGHGDALLRNFMKMPGTDTPSKIFDVRGTELPENSPDRVDIPYELGKMLHGIFLEIVRKNSFSIEIVNQTDGRLNFRLNVDATDPSVKTFLQVRAQMPELFKHNKALNEVLKNEPDWLKKALFAEATHFLADAVNRLENDRSGHHALAYYLIGVMLMQNIMDDNFTAFKEPTWDSMASALTLNASTALTNKIVDPNEVYRTRFETAHAQAQIIPSGDPILDKIRQQRIAIIGASGFLGKKISQTLKTDQIVPLETGNSRTSPTMYRLDITDPNQIKEFISVFHPDIIIYVAGEVDINRAENQPQKAAELNATAITQLHEAGFTGKMIYLSTDFVFDGTSPPYKADDPKSPINMYGKTKAQGEDITLKLFNSGLIIRSGFLFGYNSEEDKLTFVKEVIESLDNNKPIYADDISIKYPILIDDVATLVLQSIKSNSTGILQINGDTGITKFQLAHLIAQEYANRFFPGSDDKLTRITSLINIETSDSSILRPKNTKMNNSTENIRGIHDGIQKMLSLISLHSKKNIPSNTDTAAPGGVDFTGRNLRRRLTTTGSSVDFQFTPEMINNVQNAPGFVPVLINTQPLINLPLFLGSKQNQPLSVATAEKL